jgi:hypothetical protein
MFIKRIIMAKLFKSWNEARGIRGLLSVPWNRAVAAGPQGTHMVGTYGLLFATLNKPQTWYADLKPRLLLDRTGFHANSGC